VRRASLLLLAAVLSACDWLDRLVGVDAPSRIVASDFETPANATAMLSGVVGDFECALAHYVVAAGEMGDELAFGGGEVAGHAYDRRYFETSGLYATYATSTCTSIVQRAVGVYKPLSTARWQADNLTRLLEGWTDAQVPNRTSLLATAAAYAGYSLVLLGEGMCSAAIDVGPELTPAQLFEQAAERFTNAITNAEASNTSEILNMARVGRARALLNLGRPTEAAADAQLIPAGFVKSATYSGAAPRRENIVHVANQRWANASVDGMYRNMTFQGVRDPRVDVVDAGRFTNATELVRLWVAQKYSGVASPIQIATWEEAQLIVAEAELAAGNVQAAVDIINALHERVGLPPFNSTVPAEVRDQIIYERRAELFLESQHLGDFKRYGFSLNPPPGTPFPFGGDYGSAVCIPLPDNERNNNPNIPQSG